MKVNFQPSRIRGLRFSQVFAGAIVLGIMAVAGWKLMRLRESAESGSSIVSATTEPEAVADAGSGKSGDPRALGNPPTAEAESTNNWVAMPSTNGVSVYQTLVDKTLRERHGSMPIQELVQALCSVSGGQEIQEIIKALAVRKAEALPLVQEKLRTGDWWEKHMLTKLLRYSPWPEAYADLLELALSKKDHVLARQGALYALAALGNAEAGSQLLPILGEPDCPTGVQLVAIAALGRLSCREAEDAIRTYTKNEDLQIRIFANRALSELGQPADVEFLLSALDHADHLVRDEACAALGLVPGDGIAERLQALASGDPNEAVRISAKEALLQREMRGQTPAGKLEILSAALAGADGRYAAWIVQAMLGECGSEGRAAVAELARREDRIGERAGTYLIWSGAN